MPKSLATLLLILILCSLTGCGNVELGSFKPAAPSDITAKEIEVGTGSKAVLLTWNASKGTTPSQDATFNVYRGQTATGSIDTKTRIAEGITSTSFVDSSSAATASYYQVTATIYGKESAPSSEVTVSTGTPAAVVLSGTPASAGNIITWTAAPGATEYVVYRGVTASGTLANKLPWHNSPSNSTSFTDSTVAVGLTYYYQVVFFTSTGTSPLSNEVAVKAQ
jgi:fibronectin type 3 domain-containing protein